MAAVRLSTSPSLSTRLTYFSLCLDNDIVGLLDRHGVKGEAALPVTRYLKPISEGVKRTVTYHGKLQTALDEHEAHVQPGARPVRLCANSVCVISGVLDLTQAP